MSLTLRTAVRSRRRSSLLAGAALIASLGVAPAAQAAAPTINTTSSIALSQTATNLAATVNAGGKTSVIQVEYGLTASYGSSQSETYTPSGGGTYATWFELTGLSPATVYHYRFRITNADGTAVTADKQFVTPAPPSIVSSSSLTISPTHENVVATVNTYGRSGTITVEYGTTTSLGSSEVENYTSSGAPGNYVTWAELTGLTTNTTYYYRVKVATDYGTVQTSIKSFVAGV